MNLSIIVAMDKNNLIGKNNEMPWNLPSDLKYFKERTLNHTIVMGRKTFESIGKPLQDRRNLILTRDKDYSQQGCEIFHSKESLLNHFKDSSEEIFVCGGTEIYKLFLPYVDKLYITRIEEEFEGDTYFPSINLELWEKVWSQEGNKDKNNPYNYSFYLYKRR
ncbi:dihydrofolate reductase [Orenia metallireducens]|jgi:dihydrofolate reductase|uniref:Dihydrofolate reductase n=1 Tax=Orenia metallireducens TaxID=1413210 RepID=A0A1C0A8B4_9FIRM|nr:dihydrofolate reductase [Orenia metallireducens]OCL26503.1 dihydrofolate reductase [Orenia metallireducens]